MGRARLGVAVPALQGRRARDRRRGGGTQGTPVELLGGLIKNKLYPELWQVRNDLTSLANEDQG